MPATLPSIVGTFLVGQRTVGWSVQETWVVLVRLDGVALDLEHVLADVTVRVGRDSADGSAQASSASVALWPVGRDLTEDFRVGVELELYAAAPIVGGWPLFRGFVSDAELDDATLSLMAAGVLANASRVELSLADWVVEPWSARAARVVAATPFGGVVERDPDFDPALEVPINTDTGTMLVESYLQSLGDSVGAAIADTPDGRVLVQALGSRGAGAVHDLDPARVLYSPRWRQELSVVNAIGVLYGPDNAQVAVHAEDEASIALYDRRYAEIQQTRLSSSADATMRATLALARGAYPRWEMPDATLLEPIPNLAIGDRVVITELPPASPRPSWTAIVEGWTHRITGAPASWTVELALSDPVLSGLALPWNALPPTGLPWNTVDPATEWLEATSLDEL